MSERQGTERLWLVWAAQAAPELEAVKGVVNPRDKGVISDPAQLDAARRLLSHYPVATPEKDPVKEQMNVRGRSEVLLNLVELKHR